MLHALATRIGGLIRVAIVVAVALAGSQLAAFMNAYEQNLAGRLAEAQRDVGLIIDRAKRADMPIHTYLEEFRKADNPVFVREGASLQAKINRAAFLADDLGALDRASVVLKPVVFFGRLDTEIARNAWSRFSPSLRIDAVGLIYTGIALLVGLAVVEIMGAVIRWGGRPIRRWTGAAAH